MPKTTSPGRVSQLRLRMPVVRVRNSVTPVFMQPSMQGQGDANRSDCIFVIVSLLNTEMSV
jgi:hypothetical protein